MQPVAELFLISTVLIAVPRSSCDITQPLCLNMRFSAVAFISTVGAFLEVDEYD